MICVSESDDEDEVDDAGPAVVESYAASTARDDRGATSDEGAEPCNGTLILFCQIYYNYSVIFSLQLI